jgi:hypothetical protein
VIVSDEGDNVTITTEAGEFWQQREKINTAFAPSGPAARRCGPAFRNFYLRGTHPATKVYTVLFG